MKDVGVNPTRVAVQELSNFASNLASRRRGPVVGWVIVLAIAEYL